jgi:hypothetical protein
MVQVLETHIVNAFIGQEDFLGTQIGMHQVFGVNLLNKAHNSQREVDSFDFR